VINWRFTRIRREVQRNCRTVPGVDSEVETLGRRDERGARTGSLRCSA
jgi:hypothetical protein